MLFHLTNNNPLKRKRSVSDARGVEKRKALATSPFKIKRKKIARRISTGRSETASQEDPGPSKTPTFHQPQQKRHPPSQAQNLGDIAGETAAGGDGDGSDDEESEEEEQTGGKPPLTKYMRNLAPVQRYHALGKAFALKYWPWPSQNWWIDKDDQGGTGDPRTECELDVEETFSCYLEVLSIKESEWMRNSFRTPVAIFIHLLEPNLTTSQ